MKWGVGFLQNTGCLCQPTGCYLVRNLVSLPKSYGLPGPWGGIVRVPLPGFHSHWVGKWGSPGSGHRSLGSPVAASPSSHAERAHSPELKETSPQNPAGKGRSDSPEKAPTPRGVVGTPLVEKPGREEAATSNPCIPPKPWGTKQGGRTGL